MFDIDSALMKVIETDGSDLHLKVPSLPVIRRHGRLEPIADYEPLRPEDTERTLFHMLTDETKLESFRSEREVDFSYSIPGVARFRVNAFVQRGSVSIVCRAIPFQIKTAKELMLPEVIDTIADEERGLILLTGTTGSGKSTTLAAMLNHRNENSSGHILTIEDPVEFTHPNKSCIVNQREIGQDTHSYHNALKSSLREAPDVILIGEIRDRETMEAALELAGTGHLAISTLHANNANQTMDRIINMFPEQLHKQLFMDLSLNLRGIISQRLVASKDGKRVAAVEILLNTPHIADLILKGRIDEVKEAMQESPEKGMQTFDDSLYALYQAGEIELEEALRNADSRANLEAKINFG
jgi:twitching motility protein PilU